MDTLVRPPRPNKRDDVRSKVRGPRRFHRAEPDSGLGGPPPSDDDGPIWPAPRRSDGSEEHLQWPYWLLLLVPWTMWGVGLLLEHMNICLICVPEGLSLTP